MEDEKNQEDLQKEKTPIEEAKDILAQIKEENKKREELLAKENEMRANDLLSGKAEAGTKEEEEPEESPKEYAEKIMRGDMNKK